jgi:hypothetical protein
MKVISTSLSRIDTRQLISSLTLRLGQIEWFKDGSALNTMAKKAKQAKALK